MLKEYRKTARTAGVWWLLFIIIGPISYLFVDEKLLVPGDAAATVNNINSALALFWFGAAAFLAGYACFIMLGKSLCKLFKTVDPRLTKWMIGLVIVGTAVVLIGKAAEIAAANADNMDDAAGLLDLRLNMEMAGELFWGLWLVPLVMLIFKSVFIHRAIGGLLLLAAGYHLAVFSMFFIRGADVSTHPALAAAGLIGEIAMVLWLLVKGVKTQAHRFPSNSLSSDESF